MATETNWVPAQPRDIPAPTYWPVTLALGVTAVAGGLVTSWVAAAVGGVLIALALYGWIGDIVAAAPSPEDDHE